MAILSDLLLLDDTSGDLLILESGQPTDNLVIQQFTASAITAYSYDLDGQSFWPISLGADIIDPQAVVQFEPLGTADKSDVVVGCRDGFARQFDNTTFQDDTLIYTSYVVIGPEKIGSIMEAMVQQLDGVLTNASGNVTWEVYVGQTYEAASDTSGAAKATGTWVPGTNTTARPRVKGVSASFKLLNAENNDGWSVEAIDVVLLDKGTKDN